MTLRETPEPPDLKVLKAQRERPEKRVPQELRAKLAKMSPARRENKEWK